MKRKPLDLSAAQNAYQFPYIAVMTILCIFFLMMYAYYSKLFTETNTANRKLVEQVEREIKSDPTLSASAKVELTDEGVRLVLPTSILFGSGSDSIRDEARPVLEKLAASMTALPKDFKVSVEGYTDDSPVWYGGDFTSNWELSLYRAQSIIDLFIQRGNDADRFVATGYGEYRPVQPNDSEEHRAANRRVEIMIKKKEAEMKPIEVKPS
jgi:chemotaxis protein MotB